MRYQVTHRTEYRYRSSVSVSQHLLHLRPRNSERQQVANFAVATEPAVVTTHLHTDFYGNYAETILIDTPHQAFAVTSSMQVELSAPRWPHPEKTPSWEEVRDLCGLQVSAFGPAPGEFAFGSPYIECAEAFRAYALPSFPAGRPLLVGVLDLIADIHRDFHFDPLATNTATPIEEAFRQRRGVCQDFAQIGIACLRSLGLPARYVSGYLETVPPPGRPRLAGADASHAWLAVWCPGHGWIDADPTNDLLPTDRHITVAWGRDFGDVSPIRGVAVGGGEHDLRVAVDVVPI